LTWDMLRGTTPGVQIPVIKRQINEASNASIVWGVPERGALLQRYDNT